MGLILLCLLFVLLSCQGGGGKQTYNTSMGDTIRFSYSKLLQVVEYEHYTEVKVRNPWHTANWLHSYILVPSSKQVPDHIPSATILRTPLTNVQIYSTVHARLISDFGKTSSIGGVCDLKYMNIPEIIDMCARGKIIDCGSSLNVDVERVIKLSPDAVFVLPFENGGYGKVENLGFPLVECAEYMESSPLGQAEWIRFYGLLLGKQEYADSLFNVIADNYIKTSQTVKQHTHRPKLMCELKSNSAWYVPGGKSTMGQIYEDAGADYIFSSYDISGSLPLSFETVLDKSRLADIWLMKYGSPIEKTYDSLLKEFEGYSLFKPFIEKNIYFCNVSKSPFYEETPFRPDWLLKELISIFYPSDVFDNNTLRYYEKMQ